MTEFLTLLHISEWKPYPCIYLRPEKDITFGRSLPAYAIIGSTMGTCRREWEMASRTRLTQTELLIMKCINWTLSEWVTERVWLVKNLNFNILISFFHYLKYLFQLFEGLSQVKKLLDVKTTHFLSGSTTTNWYSSKIRLETALASPQESEDEKL